MKLKKMVAAAITAALAVSAAGGLSLTAEEFETGNIYSVPEFTAPTGYVEDIVEFVSEEEMDGLAEAAEANEEMLQGIEDPQYVYSGASGRSLYSCSSLYYYNQMTTGQKNLYNQVVSQCNNLLNSSADLTNPQKFSNSNDMYYAFSIINYSSLGVSQSEAEAVLTAVYYSNPQFYFLVRTGVSSTRFNLCADYEFGTAAARKNVNSQIDKVVNEWMSELNAQHFTTDFEKEFWMIRKICDNITYNLNAPHHQTIVGALVDKECVCNGYTMATTYLFNAAGIECVGILGIGHAWNAAKIDGIWYEVDNTFIDSNTQYFYYAAYLNISSETAVKRGGHTLDSLHTTRAALKIPVCTKDMFTPCGGSYNTISDEHDFENGFKIVLKEPTCITYGQAMKYCSKCYACVDMGYYAEHEYIYKSDETGHWQECKYGCGTISGKKEAHTKSSEYTVSGMYHLHICTNPNCAWEFDKEKHTFADGVCSGCGINVLPGDVDGNGTINNRDVTALRRIFADGDTPPAAADMNGDGKADNKDLTALRRYLVDGE